MSRFSTYHPKYCQLVIDMGKEGKTITQMAVEIGVDRDTIGNWRKAHESFAAAMNIALLHSQAWWEDKGRTATFGGSPGFNATSYIFNMKNRFGHDYSDVSKVDINQNVNHNLKLDSLSQDQLAQLALMLAPKGREPLTIEGSVVDDEE